MRRLFAFASVAALALSACATGTSTAPSTVPSGGSPDGSAGPSPAPTPTVEPLDVKVTFDGTECVYAGPTVLLDGTALLVEFAPTVEEAALVMGGVAPGITWDEIVAYTREHRASEIPSWYWQITMTVQPGPGTAFYTVGTRTVQGDPIGGHMVGCSTSEESTDTMYPAELLEVAGS